MNSKQTDETSFSNRIKNYGYDLLSQKNIKCDYVIDVQAEKKLQKPEARKNILLIVKEAMNNIAKYSGASHAEVHITMDKLNFLIKISDNGKGFEVGETTCTCMMLKSTPFNGLSMGGPPGMGMVGPP